MKAIEIIQNIHNKINVFILRKKDRMEEIKSYTLKELTELEARHKITIKASFRYIPIQIYSPTIKKRYEQGKQKRPYSIRYIRLEDVKKLLNGKVDFTYLTTK